ncbi:hypothetical protein BC936DRAFT_145904 [Jimgerdemannia flammicorona]|uniref:Adhesin domain-containing protein n=1 Tax=Jimgerdemannia flammicorona TaxID=994334 RepID=A0A433D8Y2_9FUNG|nr:hypothetical protein BC936DRAFT_145904 [Jimgerdemannia flammicorona]
MSQYAKLPTADPEKLQDQNCSVLVAYHPNFAQPAQPRCEGQSCRRTFWKRFLICSFVFFLTFNVARNMCRNFPGFYQDSYYTDEFDLGLNYDGLRICEDVDLIPWRGNGNFEFDPELIRSLIVKLNGMTQHGTVNIHSHDGNERNSTQISVQVLLSDENLQKTIVVDAFLQGDAFSVFITTPRELTDECVKVDIEISFPSTLASFGDLEVKVPNFDVYEHCIAELRFNEVDIGTTYGNVFAGNLVASSAYASTTNGAITGHFAVSQSFEANVANGWVNATVEPFAEGKWDLSAKSVNGWVKLAVLRPVHVDRLCPGLLALQSGGPAPR